MNSQNKISLRALSDTELFHPKWRCEDGAEVPVQPFPELGNEMSTQEVNELVTELLEEAPSDSSIDLHFSSTEKGVQGELILHSQQGELSSYTEGPTFEEVARSLFDEAHARIESWREDRFADEVQ